MLKSVLVFEKRCVLPLRRYSSACVMDDSEADADGWYLGGLSNSHALLYNL